jgi:hypothetical protein
LGADRSSRAVERTLRVVGLVPPSRAFVAIGNRLRAE